MNEGLTTTGILPLTIGSVENFQLAGVLNDLPWDFTGGTVTLLIADPGRNVVGTINATIANGDAYAQWTIIGPTGAWSRVWIVVDSQGRKQVSRPICFDVVASP